MIRDPEAAKNQGIFYTPLEVAAILARWAIRTPTDLVLDPSYGGCAMLEASFEVLSQIGAREPGTQIHGIDVDPVAAEYARPLLAKGVRSRNLHKCDFLRISRSEMPRFSAIVWNPPYVRPERIKKDALQAAQKAVASQGVSLSLRSNYWTYFVVHSTSFLSVGGRLALVLPGAFLQADYARTVRSFLAVNFSSVVAIRLLERVFPGADETSVIVLADGKGGTCSSTRVIDVNSVQDLSELVRSPNLTQMATPLGDQSVGLTVASEQTRSILDSMLLENLGWSLGSLARVRIGAVTGFNKFFVLNKKSVERWGLPSSILAPIISRADHLGHSLELTREHLDRLWDKGKSIRLLRIPEDLPIDTELDRYLLEGIKQKVPERYKCKHRKQWYSVTDWQPPDAFLTCMSWTGPRLIINKAKVDCTNALHRVWWNGVNDTVSPEDVVVGLLSSVSQIFAEMDGRTYGGGVLKFEPSSATRLWIPRLAAGADLFLKVNRALSSGDLRGATLLADMAACEGTGCSWKKMEYLRNELYRIRLERQNSGKRRPLAGELSPMGRG